MTEQSSWAAYIIDMLRDITDLIREENELLAANVSSKAEQIQQITQYKNQLVKQYTARIKKVSPEQWKLLPQAQKQEMQELGQRIEGMLSSNKAALIGAISAIERLSEKFFSILREKAKDSTCYENQSARGNYGASVAINPVVFRGVI